MYLYMHISPSGKKYIGITKQKPLNRWKNGEGYKRNEYFYRAILKYGWDNFEHRILYSDLSEEEANQKEYELIKLYDLTNPQKGYNLRAGGLHHEMSEVSRRKLSKSKKGKQVGEKNPFYGKTHSSETLLLLRDRVEQYSLDGEYIKSYASMRIACIENNIDPSELTKVCKGKRRTCGGYQWKYEDDDSEIKPYKRMAHNARSVAQLNEYGFVMRIYRSLAEAATQFGKNADKCIGECCRGTQKTAYGFRWRYE